MKRTDAELHNAVLNELAWDTQVEDADIAVAVEKGVVTLTGTVTSWGARLAAREAAYRISGVLDVDSRLEVEVKVGSARRSDIDIAAAVRNALDWDVFIPDTRIQATVSDGQVTLQGEADHYSQRHDAEETVAHIGGVRRVVNEIVVKPPHPAPTDIRKSIEAALERRATREARRINLEVHDGRVILSGTVHSWAERKSVVGAARSAPGVRSVDDRLTIEP
jgi:osmotically-inducible protein OsmY